MTEEQIAQALAEVRETVNASHRQLQALDMRLQSIEKVDKLVLIEIRGLLTKMDRLLAPARLKRSI